MITTENIVQEFSSLWGQAKTLWVGYSGGLDSAVLLHLLSDIRRFSEFHRLEVKAIHVNHQLSPNAEAWQQHCIQFCDTLNIPIVCEKIAVVNQGKGIESAAREGRYEVFARHMTEGDCLFCGHHEDDLAETVLYRLLRGSGLQGLTGIAKVRDFESGKMIRPLLGVSRDEILAYGQQHHVRWVEDESNEDPKYDRNYLRHKLFPVLQERWPHVKKRISATAQWLTESNTLLTQYAEHDLEYCQVKKVFQGESLSLEVFQQFSYERQKHVLRYWCQRLGFQAPDATRLAQYSDILTAREDAKPCLSFGDYVLRRYKKRLYLVEEHQKSLQVSTHIQWDISKPLKLADNSMLSCRYEGGQSSNKKSLVLSVKWERSGVRCQPKGRAHSQSLKKLLQEYHVEPWLRDRIPLIYLERELLAVGNVFVCDVTSSIATEGITFYWQ